MHTKSMIHTGSLGPGVSPEPVRVNVDTVVAHLRRTATVTGTTEREPLAEILADRARRALDEAWAADWGWPWMKAIWHAAAAEWQAARAWRTTGPLSGRHVAARGSPPPVRRRSARRSELEPRQGDERWLFPFEDALRPLTGALSASEEQGTGRT